jgi:hypothetical protein
MCHYPAGVPKPLDLAMLLLALCRVATPSVAAPTPNDCVAPVIADRRHAGRDAGPAASAWRR